MENSHGSFQDLVQTSPLPIFVDFWAEWCGPCRVIGPSVQRLAEEMTGKLTVVKINVDKEPDLAESYGVSAIPTLMLLDKGKVVKRWIGAMPYEALKREVENNMHSIPEAV